MPSTAPVFVPVDPILAPTAPILVLSELNQAQLIIDAARSLLHLNRRLARCQPCMLSVILVLANTYIWNS